MTREALERAADRPDSGIARTVAENLRGAAAATSGRARHRSKASPVEGDARLIAVVLENLLGNAWKYTGRRPSLASRSEPFGPDSSVAYFVRDNGAGFDMAYADKLFGVQRLHTTEEFEGTGIGLATVERIVHRHGGRIRAEAEVDRGATFFFTLASGPQARQHGAAA